MRALPLASRPVLLLPLAMPTCAVLTCAVLTCAVLACATPPRPVPSADAATASAPPGASATAAPQEEDPELAEVRGELERRPGHGPLLFFLAQLLAEKGHREEAVQRLTQLADQRWPFALPPGEPFSRLEGTPGFVEVAERLARATPPVQRCTTAFVLQDASLMPEGIAYDPRTRLFLVGSIGQRKVVAVDRQGRARDLVAPGAHGLGQVLGMTVDGQGRLWTVANADGRSALFVLALPDGRLLRKVELAQDGKPHLLNDVALGRDGRAFVTDSKDGGVWVLAPDATAFEPLVPAGTLGYPNGLALSEDGGTLYLAAWDGLRRVDVRTGQLSPLPAPEGVVTGGVDGLQRHGRALLAVQNSLGAAQVRRFTLSEDGTRVERAEVLETGSPLLDLPTTGTVADDGAYYFIGNSSIRGQQRPAHILRLPL